MTEKEFLRLFNDIDNKFVDEEIKEEGEIMPPVMVKKAAEKGFSWGRFAGIAAASVIVLGGLFAAGVYFRGNNFYPQGTETDTKDAAESTSTLAEASEEFITTEPEETGIRVNIEGDPREFVLTGNPHSAEDFVDFGYEDIYENICSNYATHVRWDPENLTQTEVNRYMEKNDAMFDSLDEPEIRELYLRASALWSFFKDTEAMSRLSFNESYSSDDDKARLKTPSDRIEGIDDEYVEMGVKSDQFLNALYDVFSEEAVEELREKFPWYVFYNGEVWCPLVSGAIGTGVGAELELTKHTDTEIEFKTVLYKGEDFYGTTEYSEEVENPEVYKYNNRFVKTEKGWRVAEIATTSGSTHEWGGYSGEQQSEDKILMDGSAASDDEILSYDPDTGAFTVNSCFVVPFSTVNKNRVEGEKGDWIKLKAGDAYGGYTVEKAETIYSDPTWGDYRAEVTLSGKLSCTGTARVLDEQVVELVLDEEDCKNLMGFAPYMDQDFSETPSQDRIYMWITYKTKDCQKVLDALKDKDEVRVKLDTDHFILKYVYGSEYGYDGRTLINSVNLNEHTLEIVE